MKKMDALALLDTLSIDIYALSLVHGAKCSFKISIFFLKILRFFTKSISFNLM